MSLFDKYESKAPANYPPQGVNPNLPAKKGKSLFNKYEQPAAEEVSAPQDYSQLGFTSQPQQEWSPLSNIAGLANVSDELQNEATPQISAAPLPEDTSAWLKATNDVAKGAAMGLKDLGASLGYWTDKVLGDEEGAQATKDFYMKDMSNYEAGGTNFLTGAGRVLSQSAILGAPAGAVGGAIGKALGGGLAGTMGDAAAQGAIYMGAPMSPTDDNLSNAALGAGLGALGGVVGNAIGNFSGKYIKKTQKWDAAKQAAEELEAQGITAVKPIARDYGSGFSKKVYDNILDKLPLIGTMGNREKQANDMFPMVQGLVKKLAGKLTNNTWQRSDFYMGGFIKKSLKKIKNGLDKDYKAAWTKAFPDEVKNSKINLDAITDDLTPIVTNPINSDFLKSTAPKILDRIKQLGKNNTAETTRELIEEVGGYIGLSKRSNVAIGKDSKTLTAIKKKLDDALGNHILENFPGKLEDYAAAKKATEAYHNMFGKIGKDSIERMVKNQEYLNEFVLEIMGAGKNQVRNLKTFSNLLDDQGKTALQVQHLNNALEKSMNGELNLLNPAQFINEINKGGAKELFKGETLDALEGVSNLMSHAQQAYQGAINPATGQQVMSTAGALGAMGGAAVTGGAAAAVGAGLTIKTMSLISNYSPLRRMLIKAKYITPKTDPGVVKAIQQEYTKLLTRATMQSLTNQRNTKAKE